MNYIERDEYEARESIRNKQIDEIKHLLDEIKASLEKKTEDKVRFIRDTVLALIAGGGLSIIMEYLARK